MKVSVTGKSLQMPNLCACCAEAPDTNLSVMDMRTSGNKRITTTWQIPYCSQCKAHAEYMKMGALMMLWCLMTFGLGLIGYFLMFKPMKRSRARSSMCKATCGSTDEAGFATDGVASTFDFPSEVFAKKFSALNRLN